MPEIDEEVNTYASPIGNKTNNSSFIKFDQTTTSETRVQTFINNSLKIIEPLHVKAID